MERGVFPKHEVAERMGKFVLVRLYVDDPKPASRSAEWALLLKERFQTSAIPLYAAFGPDGAVLGSIAFPGGGTDAFAAKMAAWMDGMLEKARR